MPSPSDDPRPPEVDELVNKRVAERLAEAEEKKWIGVVNTAVEAINFHLASDAAHPRIVALVERAVQATERMEQMMAAAAPEDVRRYLPVLLERERQQERDKKDHDQALRKLTWRISFGIPVATAVLAGVDILLRLAGR